MPISDRQKSILASIVETYAKTAEPVGSAVLSEQFGVSPATIRSEMAELERQDLIMQPHISAGRVPTDKGYRYYVNDLQLKSIEPTRSSRVLQKRVESAGYSDRAIRVATDTLAELTHNLALSTLSDGLYMHGLAGLFGHPEFSAHQQAHEVARLLDSLDEWLAEATPDERVSIYIGRENPIGKASGCSLIITRFSSPYSQQSYIGVLGPTRQNYERVINLVDYAGRTLEERING